MSLKPSHGPGWAHQRLEMRARILERRGEDPLLVEAIRVMLAWRSKVLTEKHGPPRDYSRTPLNSSVGPGRSTSSSPDPSNTQAQKMGEG